MTHPAPSFDFYDDGLVHGHGWARNTPPGGHHAEFRRAPSLGQRDFSGEESIEHKRG